MNTWDRNHSRHALYFAIIWIVAFFLYQVAYSDDRLPAAFTTTVDTEHAVAIAEDKCQKFDGREFIECIENESALVLFRECKDSIDCKAPLKVSIEKNRCVCR